MLVFLSGNWIDVAIPRGHDPSWIDSDKFHYATMYTAAVSKGFAEKRAASIAEAAVSKRLYPGLQYDSALEEDLRSLY